MGKRLGSEDERDWGQRVRLGSVGKRLGSEDERLGSEDERLGSEDVRLGSEGERDWGECLSGVNGV